MGAEGSASLTPPSSTTGSARFRRLFQVGKGGMGTVDVALERGDGAFQRIVALKRVLRENAADPRNREMFFREARLAALLSHPNVVHAFNFGELDGEPFLTMEYVEGEALSRLIAAAADRGSSIPVHLAAHLLAELCEGLHAVHELRDVDGTALNVVHRDLSPHNVMVSYAGHVKLLDFGIAKFDSVNEDMTRTGEVKGKVAYMSPEQALGDKVDRRSDLYALGAMLFELLTGRRMWGSGTEFEVMRRLALEDPPSLREALPDAPESLVVLFGDLVARKPSARPTTAADVAARLHEIARASGDGGREALEQHMRDAFGDRADERRATMGHALRSRESEVETRSVSVSGNRSSSDMPTRSEDRVAIPKERSNVALAVLAVGLASAVALAIAVFGSRAQQRPIEPPVQVLQPVAPAIALPPATSAAADVAPPQLPPAETQTPTWKRPQLAAAKVPPAAPPAPATTAGPSPPQATSPLPPPSVPLKRGSDMPLIPSPVP